MSISFGDIFCCEDIMLVWFKNQSLAWFVFDKEDRETLYTCSLGGFRSINRKETIHVDYINLNNFHLGQHIYFCLVQTIFRETR